MDETVIVVARNAVCQSELEALEREGRLKRTGECRVGDDGGIYPWYVDLLDQQLREAFDEAERRGIIAKTGEYRMGMRGILEPVYKSLVFNSKHPSVADSEPPRS